MPITREKKQQVLDEYREMVKKSPALVFTHYRGSSVKQQRSLRVKLREAGVTYVVTKNTLLGIALKDVRNVDAEALLKGPNGVAFIGDDISKGVTALKDWIKENKAIEITGALLETSVMSAVDADKLSDLPSKDQVRAQLLGLLASPASKLVQMIAAPGASLARVINAHAEPDKEAA